jgi:hypothetical protein
MGPKPLVLHRRSRFHRSNPACRARIVGVFVGVTTLLNLLGDYVTSDVPSRGYPSLLLRR